MSAYTRVNPPTLPMNMSAIRMHLEAVPSEGVMPMVKPTVPSAEAVSNVQSVIGSPSIRLIAEAPMKKSARYMINSVAAVFTAEGSSLRLNRWTSEFCLIVDTTVAASTAKVVVFIPPAVDPGDPPISISTVVIPFEGPERSVRSVVLKPAVLGVTAWKKEHKSLSPNGMPLRSTKKSHIAGKIMSMPDTVSAVLLCMLYFEKRNPWVLISSHVRKPMPPIIISSITGMETEGFAEKAVSEEYSPVTLPITSKPALQNADTE